MHWNVKNLAKKKQNKADKMFAEIKEKRKNNKKRKSLVRGLRCSKIWHQILLPLLKLLRIIGKQNIRIVADKHINTKRPVIYACTHIGFYDIMILFEVIKKPCWLFWGNPGEDLTTIFGWMARKNGTVLVDAYDREDRKLAKIEAENLLKQGGSLMIFPEGAWNITDNEPVMKLFPGTVSMALSTGAEIVPIAIEQYDKTFYVNIGKNIDYASGNANINELTDELRNILATLKWDIWEMQPLQKRKNLSANIGEQFRKKVLDEADGKYTFQMIQNERYHDKSVDTKEEVFAFLDKIKIRKENIFLYKRK